MPVTDWRDSSSGFVSPRFLAVSAPPPPAVPPVVPPFVETQTAFGLLRLPALAGSLPGQIAGYFLRWLSLPPLAIQHFGQAFGVVPHRLISPPPLPATVGMLHALAPNRSAPLPRLHPPVVFPAVLGATVPLLVSLFSRFPSLFHQQSVGLPWLVAGSR